MIEFAFEISLSTRLLICSITSLGKTFHKIGATNSMFDLKIDEQDSLIYELKKRLISSFLYVSGKSEIASVTLNSFLSKSIVPITLI